MGFKFVQAGGRFVVRILTKKFVSFSVTLGVQLNVKMYVDEQKKIECLTRKRKLYMEVIYLVCLCG